VRVRSDVTFSEARDEAHVSLVVEPGPRTIVEHVVLAGLDLTRESTVEREMALRPGEASRSSACSRASGGSPASASSSASRSPSSTPAASGGATWW
jgi:outer membrane protein assembly factor BamA